MTAAAAEGSIEFLLCRGAACCAHQDGASPLTPQPFVLSPDAALTVFLLDPGRSEINASAVSGDER